MILLEEFVKKGLIDKSQVSEIKNIANEKYNGDVEEVLISRGMNIDDLMNVKSEYFNIPYKKIDSKNLPFNILKYIPEDSANHYNFVPIGLKEGVLEIGILNPENIQAVDALQFISSRTGMPFKVFLITKNDYLAILENYKGLSSQVGEALDEFSEDANLNTVNQNENIENLSVAKKDQNIDNLEKNSKNNNTKIVEDAPVIKIVAVILRNAIEGNASDIHIEHTGEKVKVRYRVDGSLHTTLVLPPNVHNGVVARIKILAKLRLDEKRKPQDGSFSTNMDGRKIDFRVSTMPSYYGEKVVLRILDSEKGVKPLDQLGLSERNLKMIREALKKPYGLILITGPTGSGKSTTLYSMMNELDKEKSNIVSLEDPVEYHMPDINQSQVMPEIGYTFASGLRSILRQDPNVIMVGEIRDKETAQLAIQAALTGHLVLSTLHTNSAIGAIPRLVDMGVDPYLIAPTLVLAVAQRLSRLSCPSARQKTKIDESLKMQFEDQFKDLPEEYRKRIEIKEDVYETTTSAECPSGTRGRIAIYEMFEVNKEIQDIILKNPTDLELYKVARKNGMLTMKEDAMLKAINGIIPYAEVYNFGNDND
jgi:type IV pilus assembly protein PilB